MPITTAICNSFKLDALAGTHQPGDTYRIALYTNAATLSKETTAYRDYSARPEPVSEEIETEAEDRPKITASVLTRIAELFMGSIQKKAAEAARQAIADQKAELAAAEIARAAADAAEAEMVARLIAEATALALARQIDDELALLLILTED